MAASSEFAAAWGEGLGFRVQHPRVLVAECARRDASRGTLLIDSELEPFWLGLSPCEVYSI